MKLLKHEKFNYLIENRKLIAQFILATLFVAVGIWFFKNERSEITEVRNILKTAHWIYLGIGISITALYILLQGLMYKLAFAAVKEKVRLSSTILLFLKRNFISIFLPVGGVASLAFFSREIEKQNISKSKIHFASTIYAFIGIFSVVTIAIPIFLYALFKGITGSAEWYGLITIIILAFLIFLVYKSIISKGLVYRIVVKLLPSAEVFLEDIINQTIKPESLLMTVITSVLIDITGIVHLYVAMLVLHFEPSVLYAMLGYLTAVISLSVSPFMRGLGAVEVSMAYILTRFGYTNVEAVAITFMYRFFEFWLPLISGALSFILKANNLLLRVVPSLLLFALGIVNILSVLTPDIEERLRYLHNFLSLDAITTSNYVVLLAGIFMLITATFLLRGFRSAWWIALILGAISFIGHLTKAIDYEESFFALTVIIILILTRKEYHIKSSPQLLNVGIKTGVFSIIAVLLYGCIGFYFLDKKHFNMDFSLWQSIQYTIQNFFLVGNSSLIPNNAFAKHFLYSINVSGVLSLSFFFYTLIRPYVFEIDTEPEGLTKAKMLVEKYGNSSLDYFKIYNDKLIFSPEGLNAFIAYKVSGNFAVVLEDPVAENEEQKRQCILEFEKYCTDNSLKNIYYRVSKESLKLYEELKKKNLFLGQEGIVDLQKFSLEGGKMKAMRNAINKILDKGYKATIHTPPLKDGDLQKLKAVSDEWLIDNERSEMTFSQGIFNWQELKQQTVITVENAEEKIIAFLNIIPDYAKNEATYDLIRKTADAPGGVIDFILVELFKYLKEKGFLYVNLGFAPLSGIDSPQDMKLRSMKFAYHNIKSFSSYKGLREYKEKFFPDWYDKYLIYDHDFDLLQIPVVLSKVFKV